VDLDSEGYAARERGPDLRVGDHIEFMDRSGIDVAVLTTNAARDLEQVISLTDACAKVVKQHPSASSVSLRWTPWAASPLWTRWKGQSRTWNEGVHINCRPKKKHMDSKEMWPFYEKARNWASPLTSTSSSDSIWSFSKPRTRCGSPCEEYIICAETLRVCLAGCSRNSRIWS